MKSGKKSTARAKRPLFWRIFIAVVICVAVLIIAGAAVLALYMKQYEQSRPETVVNNYISSFSESSLASLIKDNLPDDYGSFLTKEETVLSAIIPAIGSDVSFEKRTGEYTAEKPVYTLKAGSREIARFSFPVTGKTFFGFNSYGDADLEYTGDLSDLHFENLKIKVPGSSAVTYNGKKLDSTYIKGTDKYSGPCAEYEDPAKLSLCEIYSVGEGYGTPTVVVFSGQTQLSVLRTDTDSETGDTTIVYSLPESKLHSMSFTVPQGCIVSVRGKPLTDSYITDASVEYESLSSWNASAEHIPTLVKYTLSGLSTVGISYSAAAPDGTPLELISSDEASESYTYGFPSSLLVTAIINAPSGATVKVNSITLTENEKLSESAVCSEIKSIQSFVSNPEKTVLYSVSGLFAEPKVEMTGVDGAPLTVVITDDGTYSYEHPVSDELKKSYESYVTGFIENYIKYYTDGSRSINTNFNNLIIPYLKPSSEAYTYLSKVYSSLAWTAKCTISEKNISVYDFVYWGEDCFSCRVDFSIKFYSPNSGQNTEENVSGWQIFFVGGGASPKIAKIIF